MESPPKETTTAPLNRRVDTGCVASLPLDISSWLAALLAAYPINAVPPFREDGSQTCEIYVQLKQIGLTAIITAIEKARPTVAGYAEIRLYQDWIAANTPENPHLFAAWFNLGAVLARESDRNGAMIAYGRARELNSSYCPAAVNLGLTLEVMGKTEAALQIWKGAIQTDEDRTTLLNHTARLMERLGRLDEAEATLHTSLLTNPAQPDAAQHWLHIRQMKCQWPVLEASIPDMSATDLLRRSGPIAVLALTDDADVQREISAAWIARKMPVASTRMSAPEGYHHDRIRVGYLSSGFCRHAMSYLITDLFERHDRKRFEIFGYCASSEDGSDIRRRVLTAFDHRRVVRDMSDEQAAQVIRDDEIDILIDLDGLTANTRLSILRWRPAPIQVTYLGFVGSVPLPELDYLLCGDFVIPPSRAAAYRPTPLYITEAYQANDFKRAMGCALTREDVGLPDDRFVFCCFSNHFKITEQMFAAWMTVLHKADQAVLWLAVDNIWSQANLVEAAVRAGIAPERILFAERTSHELYMSRLGLANLFLDTFPYNAGTIANDAIRMQLPLLTLCGASFPSRIAGSLLQAIGAGQGITTSLTDYITVATTLATDKHAYADYKQHFARDASTDMAGHIGEFTLKFEAKLCQLVTTLDDARATKEISILSLTESEQEQHPSSTAPGSIIVDNSESRTCVIESFAAYRVESADFGLVDLIGAVERIAEFGELELGLQLYELWLLHHPAHPLRHVACFNHGTLLLQTGHLMRAAAAFEETIRIDPAFLPAYINAGLSLERLGHLDLAVGQWLRVADSPATTNIDCIGNKTIALKHTARVFKNVGDVGRAEEALRRCLEFDPQQRDAIQHWIAVREMQCKWPVIEPWGRLTKSELMTALSPLALAIHSNDPMFQLANAWRSFELDVIRSPDSRVATRWNSPEPEGGPKGPLRIGYVSPDLREHAVGFLTAELFGLHDRYQGRSVCLLLRIGSPRRLASEDPAVC